MVDHYWLCLRVFGRTIGYWQTTFIHFELKQLLLQNYFLIFSFVRDDTKKCDDDTDNNLASVLFQRVIRYFDENITVLSKVMTQLKVKLDIYFIN